MPAQANIVLNDGQASPVAHTFAPNGAMMQPDKKIVSEWVDRSPAVKVGYLTIREQHAPSNNSQLEKLRFVIERPTTEIPPGSSVPVRQYANTVVIEAWIHDRSTVAETADMVAFAKNFTTSAYFATKVNTRERTY